MQQCVQGTLNLSILHVGGIIRTDSVPVDCLCSIPIRRKSKKLKWYRVVRRPNSFNSLGWC